MKQHDIVIIGAGPAGLSAALYLARANKDVVVLEKSAPGGKLLTIPKIDNYPGVPSISGSDLAKSFIESTSQFNVPIEYGSVTLLKKEGDFFEIETDVENYLAKAVIVATGLTNVPTIPGEKEFIHRGVSYCATCDGRFFKNLPMAVIGDNDHALVEANYLVSLASTLYLFFDKEIDSSTYPNLFSNEKVKIVQGAKVLKILGENRVNSLEYSLNGTLFTIEVSAVFPITKEKSAVRFLSPLGVEIENGFIKTDEGARTNVDGLFCIGDIRAKKLRQVVTAASDGAIASMSAISYLAHYGKR